MTKKVKKYIIDFETELNKDIKKYKPTTKIEFRVYNVSEYVFYIVQAWWLFGRKTKQYPKGSKYRRIDMRIDSKKEAQQVYNYLKKKHKKAHPLTS